LPVTSFTTYLRVVVQKRHHSQYFERCRSKEFLHPFKSLSLVDLTLTCVVVCDYAALRFVLSEQHQNLRPEDRSKLLNVSSPSVLQCLFWGSPLCWHPSFPGT
jgi:hypothetical protein